MTANKASLIKNWISKMGFKLYKSHHLKSSSKKIKYYILGNFGVYEEIQMAKNNGETVTKDRFISWTPWGIDLEIKSVKDLSRAYEEFMQYNPQAVAV